MANYVISYLCCMHANREIHLGCKKFRSTSFNLKNSLIIAIENGDRRRQETKLISDAPNGISNWCFNIHLTQGT